MHKSAMKCNETLGKWCKNKHGASKIMDTSETYQHPQALTLVPIGYFSWGDMGIPKLELFYILHLISSLFIPYT
jgi:hypothetical protein